jgi:hypothetical protein
MADIERENPLGFVDKRRQPKGQDSGSATGFPVAAGSGSAADLASVAALRTRLTNLNAGYYTATRLNGMTKNDMVYAARVASDSAGF